MAGKFQYRDCKRGIAQDQDQGPIKPEHEIRHGRYSATRAIGWVSLLRFLRDSCEPVGVTISAATGGMTARLQVLIVPKAPVSIGAQGSNPSTSASKA